MKSLRKMMVTLTIIALALGTVGCGKQNDVKKEKLVIAYQWGLAYAPVEIMKANALIEKHYDGEIEIEWKTLNGPAEIYEGIISGNIDVGHSGVGPLLTNSMKSGQCKMYSALSSQPMGLNTTRDDLQSLKDFKAEDKIALVSWGAIQHIMLAMACEKELGDAHALDNNIVTMSHPDGMQALLSGSVPCQLTTSPYFLKELEQDNIHEIKEVADAFPKDTTIIAGAASTKLYNEHRDVYNALVAAMEEAMTYINEKPDDAAKVLCEKEGVTAEKMKEYLQADGSSYDMIPHGTLEIAEFMKRAGFLDEAPKSLDEICFDNLLK